MLYWITTGIICLWLIALLIKRKLSWHSVLTAYVIGEFTADLFEGLFNLILGLYRFPTHLSADPLLENEYGIIFADFLILPFALIIFVHYTARTKHPWLISLLFAALFISLESIFLSLGYTKYIHWNLLYSIAFYVAGFRFGAFLAPRIASYNPPIPYRIRLFCFSHALLMWTSAMFAMPLLKMYQIRPGLHQEYMTDCRVTELLIGDFLAILCVIFIPLLPKKLKSPAFAFIALIGVCIALFFYDKGWLIYHNWNHFFTVLRYFIPLGLIMLYDRWEADYRPKPMVSPQAQEKPSQMG
jgi:hypothetical protein